MNFCRVILCCGATCQHLFGRFMRIPEKMRLAYSTLQRTADAAVWVESGGVPGLRARLECLTETKTRWPEPVWDYSVWTCFHFAPWHRGSGPAKCTEHKTASFNCHPSHSKLRCTQGRTLTARIYSFVFVGVNTQHIFDRGRARGIQSRCLQVSMNKQCLVTAVPPYRKWA